MVVPQYGAEFSPGIFALSFGSDYLHNQGRFPTFIVTVCVIFPEARKNAKAALSVPALPGAAATAVPGETAADRRENSDDTFATLELTSLKSYSADKALTKLLFPWWLERGFGI